MEKDDFVVRPYNTKELANHYNTTPKTFRRWLKKAKLDLGTRVGQAFSPRQVKIIIDHLGRPFIFVFMQVARFFDDSDYSFSPERSQAPKPIEHQDPNKARVALVIKWFNRVRLALSLLF